MRKFDTKVQYLKYKVLREVARSAWNDTLLQDALEIPKIIVKGGQFHLTITTLLILINQNALSVVNVQKCAHLQRLQTENVLARMLVRLKQFQ